MPTSDPFDLQRFLTAQQPVFDRALAELRAGHKRSHWMWFIFPQLRGLGRSPMAVQYGIGSLDEARAYLQNADLRMRLEQCTTAMLAAPGTNLTAILGSPDDMKFQSSMTLFALAAGTPDSLYQQALDRWCDGAMDPQTLRLIGAEP